MKKYQLINPQGHKINITIDPTAKEEFKKMTGWTEEEFTKKTIEIEEQLS